MKDECDVAPVSTPEQQSKKPTNSTLEPSVYKYSSHSSDSTRSTATPECDKIPVHSVPKPRADNLIDFKPKILPVIDYGAVLRNYFVPDDDYVPPVIPIPKQKPTLEQKVRLTRTYQDFPYPDFCDGIYTKEEWSGFVIGKQCEIINLWNELKLKDEEAKKRRQKSKEKSPKRQKSLWLKGKEYTNLDGVPSPPSDISQSYYGELRKLNHLPEGRVVDTIKILYLYDDFLSCIQPFITHYEVKRIDDDLDAVGINVHKKCNSRYIGDCDEKYTQKIDTFKAVCEERNRQTCLITITTAQKDKFMCDQAALLRDVVALMKKELKSQFDDISILDVLSYHPNSGYSHTHLVIDYALSPEMQKYLTDVYVMSHKGANRNGINFINYKNPNAPISIPISDDSTLDRCFGYMKNNAVTTPTTEKEAFAKTLFNACHWYMSKSSDYTGMSMVDVSGPIGAEVEKRLKKPERNTGTIYARISVTKSSGNEVDIIDIAFDEIPKRKKQTLAKYLSDKPHILKQYLNRGITDIYQIVELQWKAHYAAYIENRIADKAALIALKKKINALSPLEYQYYLFHRYAHVEKEELVAMRISYERTLNPKYECAHRHWLPMILELNPGLTPPENYHPLTGAPMGPTVAVAHPIT